MDLFEPGSGFQNQLHDFNGSVAPSGLFWTVRIPDSALTRHGQSVTMHIKDIEIVDSFVFGGSSEIPATVSFDLTWTAASGVRHLRPGSSDPTDPTNLAGEFRTADVAGTFSGSNSDGFTFSGAADQSLFSEFGTERNGSFLN